MFQSKVVNTVGELIDLLQQFPRKKTIVVTYEWGTTPLEVYNWADAEDEDLNWPLAIKTEGLDE